MNLFLTILKFAGIIVSGALGILGTVTVTREKNTGRLTHWGKWALGLTIAGFVTALGSQIAQQVKEQHDIRQSQARIEQQVALAKTTLNRVQRILTRFDTLSFSIRYELTANNVFSGALRNFTADKIAPNVSETNPPIEGDSTNKSAPNTQPAQGIAFTPIVVGYYQEKSEVIPVKLLLKNNSA